MLKPNLLWLLKFLADFLSIDGLVQLYMLLITYIPSWNINFLEPSRVTIQLGLIMNREEK